MAASRLGSVILIAVSCLLLAAQPAAAAGQIGDVVVPSATGVYHEVDIDRGWFDIDLQGLPSTASARFSTTAQSPASEITQVLVPGAQAQVSVAAGGAAVYRVYAQAYGSAARHFHLRVTSTHTGLGAGAGNWFCDAQGQSGQPAVCDEAVTVGGDVHGLQFIASVTNQDNNFADTFQVRIFVYQESVSGFTTPVSGPGKITAGQATRVRYVHNLRLNQPGELQASFLQIASGTGEAIAKIPVFLKWSGQSTQALHLVSSPGTPEFSVASFAGRAQVDRVYVDIPVNAERVRFTARRQTGLESAESAASARDVDLYLVHAPAPGSAPSIAPSVPGDAAFVAASEDSSRNSVEEIVLSGANLRPGRWYLHARSRSGEAMGFSLRANIEALTAAPPLRPGHYFNPQRSGHGVFVDFSSDQWILVWYTYAQDGTPTWYYAQAAKSALAGGESKWSSALYRVVWDGATAHSYVVGSVYLTWLGESSFIYSYILDGEAGSETLTRLGGGACPSYLGQTLDATGHWFSPSLSGFGYSAQFETNTEVHAAYLYDAQGLPRWLYGQKLYDDAQETVQLLQLQGACPLCAYVAPTNQVVGTMTRSLSLVTQPDGQPGIANMRVNATLASPLSGTWNKDLATALLASRRACQ